MHLKKKIFLPPQFYEKTKKKNHLKLSKNEPENIPTINITYL